MRRTRVKGTAAIVAALVITAGCTVVGTGTRTVIRAEGNPDVATFLPGYVVPAGAPPSSRVSVFKDNVEPHQADGLWEDPAETLKTFEGYLKAKYGKSNPQTALLSAEIRDLGRVPTLSPTLQAMAAAEVLKIMTDSSGSTSQKLARKDLLLNSFLNVPQSFEIKTVNSEVSVVKDTCELYYYYPHIEVDLSANVLSPSLNDRFSELIFLLRLDSESAAKKVRFVNFSPKDTDIAEFTRGMLKESTEAQAKGTYGLTQSSKATKVSDQLTKETSASPTLGGEVSLTYSEGLERDLKEAIERRTTGIFEDGRTFLADLRALRHVRIGGSYHFELLLEVPAKLEFIPRNTSCVSWPVVRDTVQAHIAIVGVVRHVKDLGLTGVIQRVPEAENDDVFEQVVLHELPDKIFWQFNGTPAVRPSISKQIQTAGQRRPDK